MSNADSLKCNAIHKSIVEQFKHAIVYGRSVKHQPQRVGLSHELADEDISKYGAAVADHVFLTWTPQLPLSKNDGSYYPRALHC
jgi:TGS domain